MLVLLVLALMHKYFFFRTKKGTGRPENVKYIVRSVGHFSTLYNFYDP